MVVSYYERSMCNIVLKKINLGLQSLLTRGPSYVTNYQGAGKCMGVNILECKNFCFELIVYRYKSFWGLYLRGLEIKGHFCERKLVELVII